MTAADCPSCKHPLPDSGSFDAWCPACDWNLETEASFVEWRPTALDNLINKVRARYAQRQFESLVARDLASLQPRWTVGKTMAYLLAAIVNGLPFVLLATGIWLIVSYTPALGAFIWGGFLIFCAWVFRPRLNPMPKVMLDRTEAPKLYAFVDRVAAANGAPKVHGVVLNCDVNASFQRAGLLHRPIVTIGLPLWTILEPQERVALLSHEFAHGMNGDSLAHGFVGNAVGTLLGLAGVLEPDPDDVLAMLFSPVFALLSGALRWLAYLMIVLMWHRSQEAEFLADYRASRTGGSEAAQSLLRKPAFGAYVRQVLDPISYSADWQKHSFFPAFREFVQNLPELEAERVHRLFERGDFSKETTHPPDWARQRFLAAHPSEPSFRADPKEMAEIDDELSKFERRLTGSLLEIYYPHH